MFAIVCVFVAAGVGRHKNDGDGRSVSVIHDGVYVCVWLWRRNTHLHTWNFAKNVLQTYLF